MKRMLIMAAGLAVLMGHGQAWAQSSTAVSDRGSDGVERQDASRDRDGRGGWGRGDRDRDDRRGYRSDGGSRESKEDDRGRDGRYGRGAGFMLQSGDTRLRMRCNPDESMRACVDAATTLLDRARTLPNTGATSTPSTGAGPASPPAR